MLDTGSPLLGLDFARNLAIPPLLSLPLRKKGATKSAD